MLRRHGSRTTMPRESSDLPSAQEHAANAWWHRGWANCLPWSRPPERRRNLHTNKHGISVMLKPPKISQVATRCLAYISLSREHHLCQFWVIKSDIGQFTQNLSNASQIMCQPSTCFLLASSLITQLMTTSGCLILCPVCKLGYLYRNRLIIWALDLKTNKKWNSGEQRRMWFDGTWWFLIEKLGHYGGGIDILGRSPCLPCIFSEVQVSEHGDLERRLIVEANSDIA